MTKKNTIAIWILTILASVASPLAQASSEFFFQKIKPVADRRCVVCHSCEAAPCQLKLDSYEGFDRGATTIYTKPTALYAIQPTRMFIDAKTTEGWRKLGFFPIVSRDPGLSPQQNLENSLLYRFLKLGQEQNSSGQAVPRPPRPKKSCICDIADFERTVQLPENHNLGMPFGAEALTSQQYSDFNTWIMMGAPGPDAEEIQAMKKPRTQEGLRMIREWESFLNAPDAKSQWTAKYLYEHLYLAHFLFKGAPHEYFELVRSRITRNGTVDRIATKLPSSDPKTKFVYRFDKIHSTIVHKTHIVYEVDDSTLRRIKQLFIETRWANEGHIPNANFKEIDPFQNFREIPAKSRYRFLIENSRMMLDFFTRGPVCSGGSMPTYVIQDNTWLFFLDPESDVSVNAPDYFDRVAGYLVTPTMDTRDRPWGYYLYQTEKYEAYHAEQVRRFRPHGYGVQDIWKGDGYNKNALLTVYRHGGYGVSVHQGQYGEIPKTFGMMDYPTFERIYYDLVAGFNFYGGLLHKLNLRLMISHLRRELEDHYLAFLPPELRNKTRLSWYGKINNWQKSYYYDDLPSQLPRLNDAEPARELADLLTTQVLPRNVAGPIDPINDRARAQRHHLPNHRPLSDHESLLSQIAGVRGSYPRFFPEISYVKVNGSKPEYFTIIANRAHRTMNYLLREKSTLDPASDTLNIRQNFWQSYPNQFFEVGAGGLAEFVNQIRSIRTDRDYEAFQNRFGISKSSPRFWRFSDDLIDFMAKQDPVNAGVIDLNRYGYHNYKDYVF